MTDKEKNKIVDILLDFYDEYYSNEINRPMIPSIYAGKILEFIDSLQEEPNISPVFDEGYWERLGEKSASKEIGDYDHKAVDEVLHPQLKDKGYRERYKRIAQSEAFKRTHEGRSVGEIMHVEGEECISEIDFGQELYKAFGQVKDFTLGLQIAKRFYDMGKNHQEPVSEQNLSNVERIGKDWKEEPVSEDLEEAAKEYSFIDGAGDIEEYARYDIKKYNSFKAGAEWGKNQAKVEIQAQSMALAHGCPKESVCSLLA